MVSFGSRAGGVIGPVHATGSGFLRRSSLSSQQALPRRANGEAQEMHDAIVTLNDLVSGLYWVVTATGSEYGVDLDRMLVTRRRQDSEPDDRLRRDGEPVRLLALVNCTLGDSMVLVLDLGLRDHGVPYTVRTTSTVVAVVREDAPAEFDPATSSTSDGSS